MAYFYHLIWQLAAATILVYLCKVDIGHTLNDQLQLKSNCVCPGYTITFAECTIVGRSSTTVWNGTVFDCMINEIALRHNVNQFNTTAIGVCNDGSILGRGIRVADNHYTSELNIMVSSDMIGKTVQCVHDDLGTETVVGKLTITKPGPFPPPNTLFISQADFVSRQITFDWNRVVTNCSNLINIHYSILALNCGNCPNTTNHTTVTCTDVPTDGSMCTFAVQTEACGDNGNLSDNITLNLNLPFTRIPGMPKIAKESLPVLITGIVLLLVTVTFVIGLFLIILWIFRKRLTVFKPRFSNQTYNSNQSEDMLYGRSMQNATIKIFDNEKMGTYGLDDNIYNKNPKSTLNRMDHPPNLSSLLHVLQGQVASSKWYLLGLALGVPKIILDQLVDYSEGDSLVEVLDYWLTHHPQQPTWQEITTAQNKLSFHEMAKNVN